MDYENFADLQGRYLETIRLAKGSGFQESDVVIDVTAGFKTNSIAGAMVTLATEAHFQYIQTVPNFERITYTVEAEGTTDPG